jgi:hypothetical protein
MLTMDSVNEGLDYKVILSGIFRVVQVKDLFTTKAQSDKRLGFSWCLRDLVGIVWIVSVAAWEATLLC